MRNHRARTRTWPWTRDQSRRRLAFLLEHLLGCMR